MVYARSIQLSKLMSLLSWIDRAYTLFRFMFLHFRSDLWQDGECITNDAEVGDGENGCVLVFVNGDNVFGTLHTRQVLNGPTDTNGDIECWFHGFTCLTNLIAVRKPTRVNNGASRACRTTESGSEFLYKMVVLCFAEATSTAHDNRCLFQCRAFGRDFDIF